MIATKNTTQVDAKALEQKVKMMYTDVAERPKEPYHFEMGRQLAERLGYPASKLNKIPAEAIESFAGVGHFFDLSHIKPGDHVVDLGSGSGLDAFYAAQLVGLSGKVIGIDMTPAQIEKANRLKTKNGFAQVQFVESYIEQIPLPDASAHTVISNGVVNLSSDKEAVFKEAARVLKPGGRLVLADIVSNQTLPESITCNASLWAACIGGAMQIDAYIKLIESAGLTVIATVTNPYQFISNSAQSATRDYGIKSISLMAVKAS